MSEQPKHPPGYNDDAYAPPATEAPPGYPQAAWADGKPPHLVSGQPIVAQPTSVPGVNWMPVPQGIGNAPPGLEYLAMIDQLLVHQKVELLEAFTGFETKNKYMIKNTIGQQVYMAKEESDCLTRQCCGPIRPFEMKITDNFGAEVIHLYRPLNCQGCCCPCCLQVLEVSSPPGHVIGRVEEEWSCWYQKFRVLNEAGDEVLKIQGPCLTVGCCRDVNFKVLLPDGLTEVGKISKQWTGLIREAFTDADNFGITFPMDLDVKMKAVMLGACFLIDYMYFEHQNNN